MEIAASGVFRNKAGGADSLGGSSTHVPVSVSAPEGSRRGRLEYRGDGTSDSFDVAERKKREWF